MFKHARNRRSQPARSTPCANLQVEHDGETLLMRGLVSSFYHKQLAQEVVRHAVEGVEVVNSIHVR